MSGFGVVLPFSSGDPEALERIAYEFCEDKANDGVLYCEARYCPHLLANCGVDRTPCNGANGRNCSPRKVVESVCLGLQRGRQDFGIDVRTILCCMRHRPGTVGCIRIQVLYYPSVKW